MSSKRRRKVLIVIAESAWQPPARLPAFLHQAGAEVDLLGLNRGLAHASRFTRSLPARPKDIPELVQALREHLAIHGEEYDLVIPCDDYIVDALCQEQDRGWLAPWFPVDPSSEAFDVIHRKDRFNRFCQQHGVRVPKNIVCRNFTEVEKAAVEIGFPVMLKSHISVAGSGVQKADDVSSLRARYFSRSGADLEQLSVQQYIPGRVGDCYVLARHGEVVQGYSYYKTRTWPGPFGPSSSITTVENPELEELCVRMAAITGFHGIFGFDWVESSLDGHYYILEFNPRPVAASYLGRYFGLSLAQDLPVLWGEDAMPSRPHTISWPGTHRMYPQDFRRSVEDGDWRSFGSNLVDTVLMRNDLPWNEPILALRCAKMVTDAFIRKHLRPFYQLALPKG